MAANDIPARLGDDIAILAGDTLEQWRRGVDFVSEYNMKLALCAGLSLLPLAAEAQSYPSPTFSSATVNSSLTVIGTSTLTGATSTVVLTNSGTVTASGTLKVASGGQFSLAGVEFNTAVIFNSGSSAGTINNANPFLIDTGTATTGTITASQVSGRIICYDNGKSTATTLSAASGTIEPHAAASSTVTISAYGGACFVSNGTNWYAFP